MNDFKYKFWSSKSFLAFCIAGIVFFSAVIIVNTFYSIWGGVPILLVGDVIMLAFLALCFVLLQKEVFVVKVYDDKITFKAILQKEKVLYLSEITNIYEYNIAKMGTFYFFGVRDITIDQSSIVDTELPEKEILQFGYPFKMPKNENTTKIIREFWEKSIIKITLM